MNPRNAALTAQNQAALLNLFAFKDNGIHQPEKTFLTDRLYLIEICADRIGFHRELRRRRQKNDFCGAVIPAYFLRHTDSVFARHEDIQKKDVKAHPFFNLSQ